MSPWSKVLCFSDFGVLNLAAIQPTFLSNYLTEMNLIGRVMGVVQEFRRDLPPSCETAKLIDGGAPIEEISASAQKEGLTSLATMLFEAEQELEQNKK
ncbi:MAG TPA: hypothetical protein VLR45_10480 [Desulfoprunum sp.]|nr:hypothetical protein [Desulfoprunum sp.]